MQTLWILIKRSAEYKPLQFLGFVYVYRIFEKLKSSEPAGPVMLNVSFFPSFPGTCSLYTHCFLMDDS